MDICQKVLFVDASTSYYRINRYKLGDFFGPVDLGLHLAGKYDGLNIWIGLLADSIFPGSNRLVKIDLVLAKHYEAGLQQYIYCELVCIYAREAVVSTDFLSLSADLIRLRV